MKVALVHDYLNAYGGAERVLEVLAEMYPNAPIYTAFYNVGSAAYERFKDRELRCSFAQRIPGFVSKLHSPLRWMAPWIWESFDLDEYDIVISSASWYITKGVITRPETLHVSYVHTPPRYLYGYQTSKNYQNHWPVRMYASLVNKGLREYDFLSAQRVDVMVANSMNVQERIEKFYRKKSKLIYPPVEIKKNIGTRITKQRGDYFLTGGRLVGGKNFELIIRAANELRVGLRVFGDGPMRKDLEEIAGNTVEFVGEVREEELWKLYEGANAFVVMAEDEDFGITPVEAMLAGTPVIAYRGGGYLETVVEGKTGVFVDELSKKGIMIGFERFEAARSKFRAVEIKKQANKFSKKRFILNMNSLIQKEYKRHSREYRSIQTEG